MPEIPNIEFWLSVIIIPSLVWVFKEVLRLLKDIRDQIVKMNINIVQHSERISSAERKLEDHEGRLRKLEDE